MVTDSSSATSPRSSFCTICSSSASATSKVSFLTSLTGVSAIVLTIATRVLESNPFAHDPVRKPVPTFRNHALLPPHQRGHMRSHRFGQPLKVVATFEQRHDAAVGPAIRQLHQLLRDPGVIGLDEIQVRERIAYVRIEAGRDNHEIGAEILQPRQDCGLSRLPDLVAAISRT